MRILRSIIGFAGRALIVACFGLPGLATTAQADDSTVPSRALALLAPAPRHPRAPRADAALRVTRLVITRAAHRGQPAVEAMSFSSGTRVCATIELANPGATATAVTVSWQRPGGYVHGNGRTLRVPAQTSFASDACVVTRRPGTWTVIVRRADGEELMRQEFDVSARSRRTSLT